jgi:hypothetical protein
MSILSFPRINFSGVFNTNPCTCNNDDVEPEVVQRDSDTFGPDVSSMSDDQIFAYMRQPVNMSYKPGEKPLPFIKSGWNLYGDYTTTFDNAVVTSIVNGPGAAITSRAADPLIGEAVALLGSVSNDPQRRGDPMLCDLDPTGLVTTQLWIGGLQFGANQYSSSSGPFGPQFNFDTRGFQNWLNFFSTIGAQPYGGEQNFVGIGCTMQFAIPSSALPPAIDFPSLALVSFVEAARAAGGIVVRFRLWEVEPQIMDKNLQPQFANGQAQENPALGYLVGTVGVWGSGEPASETAGRKLTCPFPRPEMTYADPQGNNQTTWPPQANPWTQFPSPGPPPALIGNAVALVQPAQPVISLDLSGSFPKYGYRNPNGPQQPDSQGFSAPKFKASFGNVELAVIPAGSSTPVSIAPIDYGLANYATYEDFGGIVDLPFDPALAPTIKTGTLVVRGTSNSSINAGTILLQETPLRVVTDDRATYWLPNSTNTIGLKVYDRGGATTADTTIYLYEYFNVIQQLTNVPDTVRPNQTVQQDTRGLLKVPSQITIPAGQGFTDWFPVQVSAVQSGATILAFQTDPTQFGQGNPNNITGVPCWSYATYSSIRIYTNDDFSHLYSNPPLQWQDVYDNVLRFYYLVYPAMSMFISLNMEDAIMQNAPLILTRLNTPDQPTFWTTYNMPVTRTMSPAKIQLLRAFIAQQTGSGQKAT